MDATFLDPHADDPGELKKPYVLRPPTKQISIRLAVGDVELARKLARQKGVPKYQTYMRPYSTTHSSGRHESVRDTPYGMTGNTICD